MQICPNIEKEYVLNFGLLEFKLYKKDLELSKLKRKLQLIQIERNNGQSIDINKINKKVEEEFKEYNENLKKHLDELEEAKNNPGIYLSKEDSAKIKRLYKKCVFKLHPDLNKNITEHEKNIFIKMTEAFKNGDLNTLEVLYYQMSDDEIDSTLDIEKLNELIDEMKEKVNAIKNSYPYNKKELLTDLNRKFEYKKDLNNLINDYDIKINEYNEKINKLI